MRMDRHHGPANCSKKVEMIAAENRWQRTRRPGIFPAMPVSVDSNGLLKAEPLLRLGVYLSVFALMAVWEAIGPRRPRALRRVKRWPGNIGISLVDALLTRLVAPAGAVGFALLANARNWGALCQINLPTWIEGLIAFVVLDLAIYVQHRVFHAVPVLWRLHRMHHADVELDVTSGARFHPAEILLSLGIKFAVVTALGAPALAVLLFEIVLNATAMFNHSNVRMPVFVEGVLRCLVVTPDMHRVHHSMLRRETDSNFGFNFPWWDRLFGTYRHEPDAGHEGMALGLEEFRDPRELRLDRLLTQPLRNDPAKRPPQE
jgi:sterol desaturase/sphingolipid hydroxylase (fatty acid hydroxylase superfamily)